jgi:hypothetical protein
MQPTQAAVYLSELLEGLRGLGPQAASCSWYVEDTLAALHEARWDPRSNYADEQVAIQWYEWLQQVSFWVLATQTM